MNEQPIAFSVCPDFLTTAEIESLRKVFELGYEQLPAPRPDLVNVRAFDAKVVDSDPMLKLVAKKVAEAIDQIPAYNVELEKLWFVRTESNDSDMSRLPYIAHFDRIRYLKGMIYLVDVDESNGPIHLLETPDRNVDRIRRRLPANYKKQGLNSYNVTQGKPEPQPILGSAGTLILFDTNTPHHAGYVKPGKVRKVVRFDFVDPRWNRFGGVETLRQLVLRRISARA